MAQLDFDRPIVTVDIVLLTIFEERLAVALLPRRAEPFANEPALIGGFVHTDADRDAEEAVRRILRAKAGLSGFFFEQLATFASAERDPRGWSVSVAYFALVPPGALADAVPGVLQLRAADAPGRLPFDHGAIVAAAVSRLRGKGAYSTIPAKLLPDTFTMSELQATYETVLGERLDPSAFRRKMGDLDLLEEVEGEKRRSSLVRRPAALYRLKAPPLVFDRRV